MTNNLQLIVDRIEHYQFVDAVFTLFVQLIDGQTNQAKLGQNLTLRVFLLFEEKTGVETSTYKEHHPNLIEIIQNEGIKSATGMAEIVLKLKDVSMNYDNRRFCISVEAYNSGAGTNLISTRSNPVTCIRHKLLIYEEPSAKNKLLINDDGQGGFMWYKDEGAKDKCIEMTVQLVDHQNRPVKDRTVPLQISLTYSNGQIVQPEGVLTLMPERGGSNIILGNSTGTETIRFRINEVSRNHRKQNFQIFVAPNTFESPESGDISPAVSVCFEVKSKRTAENRNKPSGSLQGDSYFGGGGGGGFDDDSASVCASDPAVMLLMQSDDPQLHGGHESSISSIKRPRYSGSSGGGSFPPTVSFSPRPNTALSLFPSNHATSTSNLVEMTPLSSASSSSEAMSLAVSGASDMKGGFRLPAKSTAWATPAASTATNVNFVAWSDSAHREAAEAANEVIDWTASVLNLLDSVIQSEERSSPSGEQFRTTAQLLRSKYSLETKHKLRCLQDYSQYHMQYNEKHKVLLHSLQKHAQHGVPGHPSSSSGPAQQQLSATSGNTLRTSDTVGGSASVDTRKFYNNGSVPVPNQSSSFHPNSQRLCKTTGDDGGEQHSVQVILLKPLRIALEGGESMLLGLPAFGAAPQATPPSARPLTGFYSFAETTDKTLGIYFRAAGDITKLTNAHLEQICLDLKTAEEGGKGAPRLFDIAQCDNDVRQLKEKALQAWAESERGGTGGAGGGGLTDDLVAASIMSSLKQVV